MDKIKKYKNLANIYQKRLYSLLEKIIVQPWGGFISKEEKKYIFFEKKLNNLDVNKHNSMAIMYNEISDIRAEAHLMQYQLDKQLNIKRLNP